MSTGPVLIVGGGPARMVEQHDDMERMLQAFMARRFERCRVVVEHSWQLGQWEQHPPQGRSLYPALVAAAHSER